MNIQLSRLMALAKATSKESYRPALVRLHVKDDLIEATDGYMLVREHDSGRQEEEEMLINPLDFTPFKGLKNPTLTVSRELAESQLVRVHLASTEGIQFPKTDSIMPDPNAKGRVKVALKAGLLKQLCDIVLAHQKAMGSRWENESVIEFSIDAGPLKPVYFKAQTDKEHNVYLDGAIMPYKK